MTRAQKTILFCLLAALSVITVGPVTGLFSLGEKADDALWILSFAAFVIAFIVFRTQKGSGS